MPTMIAGLFTERDQAAVAIARLKEAGYGENISYVAKDLSGNVTSEDVGTDSQRTAGEDIAAGVGVGALAGAITGAVVAALPIAPLLLAGPLAVGWGISGAALGGLSGGLVAGLVNLGIDREKAQLFEDRIISGQVLVTVSADQESVTEVVEILNECQVQDLVQDVEG